jgi:hypothetical protein
VLTLHIGAMSTHGTSAIFALGAIVGGLAAVRLQRVLPYVAAVVSGVLVAHTVHDGLDSAVGVQGGPAWVVRIGIPLGAFTVLEWATRRGASAHEALDCHGFIAASAWVAVHGREQRASWSLLDTRSR